MKQSTRASEARSPGVFMFERRHERLAPLGVFVQRMLSWLGIALCMIGVALAIGIAGYHWIGGFNWVDSFLEASMILGGMGPVNPLTTDCAKVFASLYALFSGLIFIGVMGVVLTPLAHRMMHKFHLNEEEVEDKSRPKSKDKVKQ
jgi:hypothetical protein